MASTSVPTSGSVMHRPPTHSPATERGSTRFFCSCVAVHVHVLREEHRVGEHGEREARVGGRERLADLNGRGGIEARAAVLLANRDAEQAERPGLAEEREVEGLVAVVPRGLRLDLPRHELAQRLGEQRVLRRGSVEIEASPLALVHGETPAARHGRSAASAPGEPAERRRHAGAVSAAAT